MSASTIAVTGSIILGDIDVVRTTRGRTLFKSRPQIVTKNGQTKSPLTFYFDSRPPIGVEIAYTLERAPKADELTVQVTDFEAVAAAA